MKVRYTKADDKFPNTMWYESSDGFRTNVTCSLRSIEVLLAQKNRGANIKRIMWFDSQCNEVEFLL